MEENVWRQDDMSYIQCLATESKVIFTSDGRAMDLNGNILDEKYKKIIKINETVAIAYAGIKELCLHIIRTSMDTFNTEEEIFTDTLYDKIVVTAKKELGNNTQKKAQFIVAGKCSDGKIGIMTLSTNNNYDRTNCFVDPSNPILLACAGSDGAPLPFFKKNIENFVGCRGLDIDGIQKVMDHTSQYVAIVDKSVNTEIFREILTFP